VNIVSRNGQLLADSREVADMTGVRHSDLLEKIDGYIGHLLNGKFRSVDFFIESTYQDSTGRTLKCYLLTRKGCDMVANKMTGEKGVLFTAAYVTRFEEMESQLAPSYTISDPIKRAEKWIEEQKELLALEEKNALMKPKADYFDALVDRNLLTNIRDTAKELQVKEGFFITWILDHGYVYRDQKGKLKPYAKYVPDLFKLKEWEKNGKADVQTLVTPKGKETLRLLLGGQNK
jgi:Rha family phage regulatory protein